MCINAHGVLLVQCYSVQIHVQFGLFQFTLNHIGLHSVLYSNEITLEKENKGRGRGREGERGSDRATGVEGGMDIYNNCRHYNYR